MSHKRFCILFIIIFTLAVQVSYAAKGKVGPMAQLDSDDIKIKTNKPIKNVYVTFKVKGDYQDLDILKFIQALEIHLYKKGFRASDTLKNADLSLTLNIKKITKEYWIGLPMKFGSQRQIGCLSVEATYKTTLGQWNKEFIAHKGYWTYRGDFYHRDTTTNDLSRAIINPLHDYRKEKAFINAAGKGNMDAVRVYIDGHINVDADNDEGFTAIIAASKNRHVDIVQYLISLDANVNARDQNGWSSLTYAAFNGDKETMLVLLSSRAWINTEDDDKRTPLDWAVLEGRAHVVRLLLNHDPEVGNAIKLAQQSNNKELENMLTSHKERVRSRANYDCGYLSGLIKNERQEKILFLIENDLVVVTPEDDKCAYALMTATRKGNKEIIDAFLTKGLDVNAQDTRGEAPLIEAAAQGHKEVVEMLITYGASLNDFGSSALASAAKNGQIDAVEYLLSQAIEINARGKSGHTAGETPLGEAARAGQKEMIELLLSKGAGINAKNTDGKTALMTAALEGKPEIVNLLLSKGADINQQDKDGHTVLDLVSKARMQNNTIDYRNVYNILKKDVRKKSEKRRTLKSRE